MRALLFALTAAACVPQPQYQQPPNYGGDEDAGQRAREADSKIEPLIREHIVEPASVIDGVDISAEPVGLTGWEVSVKNATAGTIAVVWDESTFVTGARKAGGRLIRGTTKRIDTAKAQPPTPVPASAELTESVFPELLVRYEEFEEKLTDREWPPQALAKGRRFREDVSKMIDGGELLVVVNTAAGKQTWSGRVRGGDSK